MSLRVLEIGAGNGGAHCKKNPHREYFALDVDKSELRDLKMRNPLVNVVVATGQYIPFPDSVFDAIEIRFPFFDVVTPGLQKRHYLQDLGRVFGFEGLPSKEPQWYQEFARVLKLRGTLSIWGDVSTVDFDEVKELAAPLFRLKSSRVLSFMELQRMETTTSSIAVSDLIQRNSIDTSGFEFVAFTKRQIVPGLSRLK